REVSAHKRAAARAELERTLAKEANHRIKNDLQTVADLLLLGRPAGSDGTPFDDTAARIRSIATVHRLLTETEDQVDGGALVRSMVEEGLQGRFELRAMSGGGTRADVVFPTVSR